MAVQLTMNPYRYGLGLQSSLSWCTAKGASLLTSHPFKRAGHETPSLQNDPNWRQLLFDNAFSAPELAPGQPVMGVLINPKGQPVMKSATSRYVVVFASLAGLALGGTALAGGGEHGANHEMTMMDTNKDGKISAAEHAAGAKKMFQTMDADQNGKVTATEMDAAHRKMMGKEASAHEMSSAEKIKMVDGDGDGVLTAEEHEAASKDMFAKMDADRDGSVTAAEMKAGHEKMMSRNAR